MTDPKKLILILQQIFYTNYKIDRTYFKEKILSTLMKRL